MKGHGVDRGEESDATGAFGQAAHGGERLERHVVVARRSAEATPGSLRDHEAEPELLGEQRQLTVEGIRRGRRRTISRHDIAALADSMNTPNSTGFARIV